MPRARRSLLVLLLALSPLLAGETKYELSGRIAPEGLAAVSHFGAVTPFSAGTLADARPSGSAPAHHVSAANRPSAAAVKIAS